MIILKALAFGALFVRCLGAQTVGPAPERFVSPASSSPQRQIESLLLAKAPSLTLKADDLISIQVYNVEAFKLRARIGRDGSVDLPLAGRISLLGLTIDEAQASVRAVLQSKQLVKDPGVVIEPIELPSAVVSVGGEVNKPGLFPALGVRTLAQLLSLAEGTKETASSVISLSRPTLDAPVRIDLGADPTRSAYSQIPVFAGDSIQVAHLGHAFALGALGKQTYINLRNYAPTTVLEAISEADGIGFQASADDSVLVRTEGTSRIMLHIHVNKMLQGKEPDVILRNDDILYVPTSKTKAAIKGGGASLIVGFASTFLYTHP